MIGVFITSVGRRDTTPAIFFNCTDRNKRVSHTSKYDAPHRLHLGLRLLPLALLLTVGQQASAGIERIAPALHPHTPERDKQMTVTARTQRAHKATVIAARKGLVVQNKTTGSGLGQPTHGGSGMKGFQQVTHMMTVGKLKGEVTAQVDQVAGTGGVRPLLVEV